MNNIISISHFLCDILSHLRVLSSLMETSEAAESP